MKYKIIFKSLFLAIIIMFFGAGISVFAKEGNNKAKDDRVSGQYIVVFKDSVADVDGTINDLEKKHNATHLNSYHSILKGFAGNISDAEVEKIKKDPRVEFVSEDRVVNALGIFESEDQGEHPQSNAKSTSKNTVQILSQTTPTGIKRVNATTSTNKGAGVVVAVIDTGIYASHPDLSGAILNSGVSCISRTTSNDDNGHGTHVSGTIAGRDNTIGVVGVAPQVKLIPVKVLDRNGSGTWSSVICGIDWVTANALKYNIKVANMSLGGGGTSDNNCGNTNNDALHKAICRSRDAGVTYVVAAGNDGANAANSVPASYDDAVITVSALADSDGLKGGLGAATPYGPDDTFATFSSFGNVVDIGAPGVNIYSTWKGGGYATLSGTSMATPHVTGAVALYLNTHPGSTWTQIRDGLKAIGEGVGSGHTDPGGLHPEKVLNVASL